MRGRRNTVTTYDRTELGHHKWSRKPPAMLPIREKGPKGWVYGVWACLCRARFPAILCLVTQLCLTLCDPVDCSLPGFSPHGLLKARILGWVAMPSSRGSSQPRDRTPVTRIAGRFFTIWATREALQAPSWESQTNSTFNNLLCGWCLFIRQDKLPP